ncbi:MAG: putative sugar transporter permease protein [Acidimicrobiales bacterium]|nr:putative sugar transporter permease protein [Acidimicrobiales bacterium]
MTDVATPAAGTAGAAATPPNPLERLRALPSWGRWLLYLAAGTLLLSVAKQISGVAPLTASNTFRSALELSLPIGLAGLGGLWSERAGVVNIGLEGMMVLGTWFGAWGGIHFGPWQGVLIGVLGGAAGGLLHAVATVTFGVDHIISGVAINILAIGATNFLTTIAYDGATNSSPQIGREIGRVDLLPFLSGPLRTLGSQNRFFVSDLARLVLAWSTGISLLVVVAALLFPLTWWVLWRTPFGLRLRAVGEDPEAAESLGVRVYTLRYVAVIVSGALAGLGGVTLVYVFSGQFQAGQTNGRGYIGLAAMIFGNWRPGGLIAGAGLFGFMDSMQSQVDATAHAILLVAALLFAALAVRSILLRRPRSAAMLAAVAAVTYAWYATTDRVPKQLIPFFPHLTTLLVLVFAAQRLRPPAADGKIFRRER